MTNKNPKVDEFIRNSGTWQKEFTELRRIILDCDLIEELKWGVPTFTWNKKNVVLIHGFKEYCAILFVKGALLKDPKGVLIQQTENVQAARQIRFTSVREIIEIEPILKAYIQEAIEVEKSGLKIDYKEATEFAIPDEFQKKLDENSELETAFYALTPGRQRAYLLFFAAPKQSQTREARIEKFTQHILEGKGLND